MLRSEASRKGAEAPDNFIGGTLQRKTSPAPRLERIFTVRHFEQAGVLHIGWSTNDRFAGKRGTKGEGKNKEENKKRSLARSRANMRRDMLSAGMQVMWTYTYASTMLDREKAIADRKEFERRVKRIYPHYVAITVEERQTKRGEAEGNEGTWHLHTAVRDWFDVRIMRNLWQEVIGEPGRVHVGFKPDGRGNAYTKLASYMSKYMGKEMGEGLEEKHRYHVCGDVNRPVRQRFNVALGAPINTELEMAVGVGNDLFPSGCRFWFSPICAEGKYGYVVVERRQHQPEGVSYDERSDQ